MTWLKCFFGFHDWKLLSRSNHWNKGHEIRFEIRYMKCEHCPAVRRARE